MLKLETTCLHTERMLLRALTPDTYERLFTTHTNEEIKSFLGFESDGELMEQRIKYDGGMATHNKSFVFFQLIDKVTGKIIGGSGYHTWYLQHARAEIGYSLYHEADKGKGLMTEALKSIIQYGFTEMKLNRIEAFIGPANEASIRLIHSLGFTKEGQLRQHYYKNGKAEDSIVYSLLNSDLKTPSYSGA
jgi:[ribosomal protein S5]-alanine N-acetyltransferase